MNAPIENTQDVSTATTATIKDITIPYKKVKAVGNDGKYVQEVDENGTGKVNSKTGQPVWKLVDSRTTNVIKAVEFESVAAIVAKGDVKELELLQEVLDKYKIDAARSILDTVDGDNYKFNGNNFPIDQISWNALANQPAAERGTRGIPAEVREAFYADYSKVMPQWVAALKEVDLDKATQLVEGQVKNFKQKCAAYKNVPYALQYFNKLLEVYMAKSEDAANFAAIIDEQQNKILEWLELTPEAALSNI